MKRKIETALLGLLLLTCSGCSDWLDVTPQAQVNADKLFSSPEGFESALYGIYISMTSTETYGQNATYNLMDVLAQYYTVYTNKNHDMYEASVYNYENGTIKDVVDAMWLQNYNTIANCNILLERLANKDELYFAAGHYNLLKGEALGIRAYLHFDLLRAFAVNYSKDPDGMAIPYAESFTKKVHPQLKASVVVEKILADLNAAREALKSVDPVFDDTFRDQNMNYHYAQPYKNDIFMSYRAYRMNYYAVTGLMARVYRYIGDKENAYKYAKEIIDVADDGAFWFASESDVSALLKERDVVMQTELLFALNCSDIQDIFYSIDATNSKNLALLDSKEIYANENDFRWKLVGESPISGKTVSYKFAKIDSNKGGKIPMIRLSEMYMIAAESYYATNVTDAAAFLGKVRQMRGISQEVKADTYEQLIEEIILEARREFVGEGQLFYLYKRLNHPVMRNKGSVELTTAQYCLPMPANEVEFGDREEEYLKY